jgi:hypothetical protein
MPNYPPPNPGILVGAVRPGRRRRLRFIGIAVLAIGLDLAIAAYRVETRQNTPDPRVADVMKSAQRAHKRQMGMLYGETAADLMSWVGGLDRPAGHASLIALASLVAAAFCFRAAQVSGPE